MPGVILDPTDFARDVFTNAEVTVSDEMFGAISTSIGENQGTHFAGFLDFANLNLIRWPGGTLSEIGQVRPNGRTTLTQTEGAPYAYDLSYPELIHHSALAASDGTRTGLQSFSEVIRLAVANQATLSVIIPTIRYAENRTEAFRDTIAFLENLFLNGAYNSGELPQDIVLDIGNEYYDPQAYGLVAAQILRAVGTFRTAHPEFEFKVALQAMGSGPSSIELIDSISPRDLTEVDAIRLHSLRHGLESIFDIENNSKAYWSLLRMYNAVFEAKLEAGVVSSLDEIDLYVSAWTTTSNDIEVGLVAGQPAASALLSLFTGLLELGADMAAAWGVAAGSPAETSLSFIDEAGVQKITASGQVFSLMSRNLIGTNLLRTEALQSGREDEFNVYGFSDESKLIVYVAANDLIDETRTVSLDISRFGPLASIDAMAVVSQLDGAAVVETRAVNFSNGSISVELSGDFDLIQLVIVFDSSAPSEHSGEPDQGFFDQFDLGDGEAVFNVLSSEIQNTHGFASFGVVETLEISVHSGDTLIIDARSSERVVSLDALEMERTDGYIIPDWSVLNIHGDADSFNFIRGNNSGNGITGGSLHDELEGRGGNDTMRGGGGDDSLKGGSGNDLLFGEAGNDTVFGGLNDDTLFGGGGNDVLNGGYGDDVLVGSFGYDTLVGGAGADIFWVYGRSGVDEVADFSLADGDRINISQYFSDAEASVAYDFRQHLRQVGEDLYVDVGEGSFVLRDVQASTLSTDAFIF